MVPTMRTGPKLYPWALVYSMAMALLTGIAGRAKVLYSISTNRSGRNARVAGSTRKQAMPAPRWPMAITLRL